MAGDPIKSKEREEEEGEKKVFLLKVFSYLEPFVVLFIGNFHMVTYSKIAQLDFMVIKSRFFNFPFSLAILQRIFYDMKMSIRHIKDS